MKKLNRRNFIKTAGATLAAAAAPAIVKGQAGPHVVVVGGGFAGATAAKYIRMWSNYSVEVTLVEKKASHISCIMSNLVLNERLRTSNLKFSYDALAHRYGVRIVRSNVKKIDGSNATVKLADGSTLAYDRLVVAAGISFDKIDGWESAKVPHAWIAGGQTNRLRNQLRAMPDDGIFVMTIPEAPYRCPPGPYERACVVADLLGRRSGALGGGFTGKAPKVIVLDANNGIQAERETFSRAYEGIYKDIVEYHSNVKLQTVDSNSIKPVAVTNTGEFEADVLNVIPRHKAGRLVKSSGLSDGGRWAPVDPLTYESTLAGFPGVHIIGDSQGTAQPKSGHMANSQAKVCADAVVRLLNGEAADGDERSNNIRTNSACFSPITFDEASWLTAVFRYNRGAGKMELVPGSLGEARDWSRDSFEKMFAWSDNLFADTFA